MSDGDVRIELTRSGGLAGITRSVSLGPGELTSGEESRIEHALEAAPTGRAPVRGVDRFQYDVTIVVDDRPRHLHASETEIPSDLRHLLDGLLDRR